MIPFDNPLHPIPIYDYPKLFDYVLTTKGLIFFQNLRQRYNQGKSLSLDEYNRLRLLYVYYATANRNSNEVKAWQELCVILDSKGIFEKHMFESKENLIKESLIVQNPLYQPGLYREHVEFIKNYFKTHNA